jgi:hypothetical protein
MRAGKQYLKMNNMKEVIEILKGIFGATVIPNHCQNERYLHHYFSRKIQECYPINYNNVVNSKLHPEWPTYKTSTGIYCGRYKNVNGNYQIDDTEGTAGFIDFAIGDYYQPEIAVEFKTGFGWNTEGIVFDFMKLMDAKNPFKTCVSFNIIFRDNGLAQGGFLAALNGQIDGAKQEFQQSLGGRLAADREFLFWIVEIAANGDKRSWYLRHLKGNFTEGIPN